MNAKAPSAAGSPADSMAGSIGRMTPSEEAWLMNHPVALRLLMDYQDQQHSEHESMCEEGDRRPWPTARWTALRERGRAIMAEDLDIWPAELLSGFGFPAEMPNVRARQEERQATDNSDTASSPLSDADFNRLAHDFQVADNTATSMGATQADVQHALQLQSQLVAAIAARQAAVIRNDAQAQSNDAQAQRPEEEDVDTSVVLVRRERCGG